MCGLSRQTFAVRVCCLLLALGGLSGCNRGAGHGEVPVSGFVTLDGEPLENLQITFQPIAEDESGFAPGSFARTDAQGKFEMRTVWPDAEGAIPGVHRVTMNFDQGPPSASEKLPQPYRQGTATFEVPPEGTTEANFVLKSE